MKTKYISILAMLLLIVLGACEDNKPVFPLVDTAPEFMTPNGTTKYVLIPGNDNGTFETFHWSSAYLGENIEVSYEVEIDAATGDFSNPQKLEPTNLDFQTVSTKTMNEIIRELGIMADEEAGLQVRVKAMGGGKEMISVPVSMLVRRYIYDDEKPVWMVQGSGLDAPVMLKYDADNMVWNSDGAIMMKEGTINFLNDNVYKKEAGAAMDVTYAPKMEGELIESGKTIPVKAYSYFISLDFENATFTVEEDNFYSLIGTAVTKPDTRFEEDGSNLTMTTRLSVGTFNVKYNASMPIVYGATSAGDWTLIEGGIAIDIANDGDYVLTIDENMVLSIEEAKFPNNLYLVGSATSYGWDTPGSNDDAEFHKIAGGDDNAGVYWKIAHLETGNGFKISAADWLDPNVGFGQVTEFDSNGETVSDDGDGNMSVASSGMYTIVIDLRAGEIKVSVTKVKVYGIGDAFGSWDENMEASLFTVDNTAKTVTSPSLPATGNIRSYVDHEWIPSWWNAEFVPQDGAIFYRNDGGDPPGINGNEGEVITYTFDDNTSAIN